MCGHSFHCPRFWDWQLPYCFVWLYPNWISAKMNILLQSWMIKRYVFCTYSHIFSILHALLYVRNGGIKVLFSTFMNHFAVFEQVYCRLSLSIWMKVLHFYFWWEIQLITGSIPSRFGCELFDLLGFCFIGSEMYIWKKSNGDCLPRYTDFHIDHLKYTRLVMHISKHSHA